MALAPALLACSVLLRPSVVWAAPVWTEQFGGSAGRSVPDSTAVDSRGNVLVTGSVTNADGAQSVATVKYDSAGHQLWAEAQTIDTYVLAERVAVDAGDNVTVVAQGYHIDEFGDYILTARLLHYSSAGKLYSNSDISEDAGNDSLIPKIFASPDGDTTLVGTVYSESDQGGSAWIVERFDSTGTLLWYDSYVGTLNSGDNEAMDAAFDGQGNIIVTGDETDNYGQSFNQNIAVRKYSPTGSLLYSSVYDDAIQPGQFQSAAALALDAGGSATVAGELYNGSSQETLLLRVKPAGGFQWARHYSVSGSDSTSAPAAIAIDHSGNIVLAGTDSFNDYNATTRVGYLLKYNPAGHRLYTVHPAQLQALDPSFLFASSRTDDVYLVSNAGSYNPSTTPSDHTIFAAKIDPSGQVQSEESYSGSSQDPNELSLQSASFDPALDAVYVINGVDFTSGTDYNDDGADIDWVTLKYRLGG